MIVMVLQEIVTEEAKARLPFQTVIVCADSDTIRIYRKTGPVRNFNTSTFAELVDGGGIQGPQLLVLAARGCLESTNAAGAAVTRVIKRLDAMSLAGEPGTATARATRFELAPLATEGPGSEAKMIATWRGDEKP